MRSREPHEVRTPWHRRRVIGLSVANLAAALGLVVFGIVMVLLACVGVLAAISVVLPQPAEPRVVRGPNDPGDDPPAASQDERLVTEHHDPGDG